MGMGDVYLSTNQLIGIFERIRIKGLLLWVKCKPCVVYGRKGLEDGSTWFLCGNFWRNRIKRDFMKKEIIIQKVV